MTPNVSGLSKCQPGLLILTGECQSTLLGSLSGHLLLDDFALQPVDPLDTADIYELIMERHRAASTVVSSNREPIEWLAQVSDALLAQFAIHRLQSPAYELVHDGESYRHHE